MIPEDKIVEIIASDWKLKKNCFFFFFFGSYRKENFTS